MKTITALAAILLLAGCWQSSNDFYAAIPGATPFHPGKVTSEGSKGERGHAMLTLERGRYRLTNDDPADSDFGDSFTLRLVTLAGVPKDVWVFDAQENCNPGKTNCDQATEPHYYGLARRTPGGAEARNPDCPEKGLPGGRAQGYGTCDFSSRASLEKALTALVRAPWKADIVYRYD